MFKKAAKNFVQEAKDEVKKEVRKESVPVFRILGALLGLYIIFSDSKQQPQTTINITNVYLDGKERRDGISSKYQGSRELPMWDGCGDGNSRLI